MTEDRCLTQVTRSLSDAAADGLSKHKGGLELNGLTSLSDNAAQHLASTSTTQLALKTGYSRGVINAQCAVRTSEEPLEARN